MRTGREAEILINFTQVALNALQTSVSEFILTDVLPTMKTAGATQIPAGFNHETIPVQFCISAVGTVENGVLPFNGPVQHSTQVVGNLLENPIGHRLIKLDGIAFLGSQEIVLESNVDHPLMGVTTVRAVEIVFEVTTLVGLVGFDLSHRSSITLTITFAKPAIAEATSAVICKRFVITSERFS